MDKSLIREKIVNVMAHVLEIAPDQINEDSSVDNIQGWGSLKQMKLILALEQELGVEFDDEEVVELLSFRLIELSVLEKLNK